MESPRLLLRNRSARWLNKSNQERATGLGASLIKRKLYESEHDDDTDEDTTLAVTTPKNRRKGVKLKDEILNLQCSWDTCNFESSNYIKFTDHTFEHLSKISPKKKKLVCSWVKCNYSTSDRKLFEIHYSYHSYFSKLKSIGENHRKRLNLPACQMSDEQSVPEKKYPFQCDWANCNVIFYRVQNYFHHVACHVFGEPKMIIQNQKKFISCCWFGCEAKAITKSILHTHVRSHLQEKIVACSCNATFISLTKFTDHLIRQESDKVEQFQCSHCFKFFASERLLRNHVRSHINHYKCHLCDMTCITPSTLSRHIRYRHLPERPFKCEICSHGCVTKKDLNVHIMSHYPDKLYECSDCNLKLRTLGGLERHYEREHKVDDSDPRMYECHCCSVKFIRGATLTRHLIRKHNYQWPSGHSRFRYRQDPDDGMYRLQTDRFESVEVTQEIIRGPSSASQSLVEKEEIVVSPKEVKLSISEDNSNRITTAGNFVLPNNVVPTDNNILITICEVDESGKMIKSKTEVSNELRITDD